MDSEKRKYAAPAGPSPDDDASKRRKVIGPALPPTAVTADHGDSNSNSDDSSDDDDFGPSLPPPEGSVPTPTTTPSAPTPAEDAPKAPQRDAWMLEPIDGSNRSSRVDPTKLRNRKFQTGRAANATPGGGGVDVSWTETPEQKMKRLQDEVLGVQTRPAAGESGPRAAGSSQPSRAMQEKVRRYNEEKRKEEAAARAAEEGEKKKKGEEEEDDPSSRAFDKEKDMALSSRITHAQRREMMNKAADFGSRFTSGKFL